MIVINGLFAQMLQGIDIIADITSAWKTFVETGQVWAMIIGVFFGYVFASFTRF